MSFTEARAAWPDKIILPNIPSSLCNQTDEQIVSFLDKLLDEAGTKVPFMLQVSEDIPQSEWQRTLGVLC